MGTEKSPEQEKNTSRLREIAKDCEAVEARLPSIEQLISDSKRPALAERMRNEAEKMLNRLEDLKNEKRILEAKLALAKERSADMEMVAGALERMPQIFAVLPPQERKELLETLVQRVVVKPWNGEKTGFLDGGLTIAPCLGTRRYFVKITLYESTLLSATFTNSVDGSTLKKIGCPQRLGGRTFDLIAVLAFPVGRSKSAPSVVYPVAAITSPSGRAPLNQVEAGVELAHRWAEGLKRGRWKTLADVAQAHRVSVARVSQLLPLGQIPAEELRQVARSLRRPSLRKLIAWVRSRC